MNVNLSILYTYTPWGCLVEVEMYDISLQKRMANRSSVVPAKYLNL